MGKDYNHYINDLINENKRFEVVDMYSFKNIKIEETVFAQNRFNRCYFKKTEFINSSFTGSYFTDSNFFNCTYENTRFDNCTFTNCKMNEWDLFEGAVKDRYYSTSELANTLSLNASSFGKKDVALKLFLEAKKYRRLHEKAHINPTKKHYKNVIKERPERVMVAKKWLRRDFAQRFLWNYGFGITNVLISAIIFIILFMFIYMLMGDNLLNGLSKSIVSFTTLGFLVDTNTSSYQNLVMGFESFIGAIYIAITASIFYSKAKRTL